MQQPRALSGGQRTQQSITILFASSSRRVYCCSGERYIRYIYTTVCPLSRAPFLILLLSFQAYSSMSPNGEPQAQPILGSAVTSAASLPPMSTFRGSAAAPTAQQQQQQQQQGAPSPAAAGPLQFSHSPGAPTAVAVVSQPSQVVSQPSSQPQPPPPPSAQDTLGKTLASVVSSSVAFFGVSADGMITSLHFSSDDAGFCARSIISIDIFIYLYNITRGTRSSIL